MSGVQYVLGKRWVIFPGQCLLPSQYTSYEAILAPGATKDAHWLLSLPKESRVSSENILETIKQSFTISIKRVEFRF